MVHTGTKLPCEKTRAWVVYDDAALYVAFHCPHPQRAVLRATAERHDADTWLDDSVEIFLDPAHDHRGYFQFCVNCRGQIRDSRGTDPQWESLAEAAVQRLAGGLDRRNPDPLRSPGHRSERRHDVGDQPGSERPRQRGDRNLVAGRVSRRSSPRQREPAPNLWRFRRNGVAKELASRQEEIDRLRREMHAAGMDAAAVAQPDRLLARAEEHINGLGQRLGSLPREDEQVLTELRATLADLAKVVPETRSLATQFTFMTSEDVPDGFRLAIAHSLQKVPRTGPWDGGVLTRARST